jgi:hypothetical protein
MLSGSKLVFLRIKAWFIQSCNLCNLLSGNKI